MPTYYITTATTGTCNLNLSLPFTLSDSPHNTCPNSFTNCILYLPLKTPHL